MKKKIILPLVMVTLFMIFILLPKFYPHLSMMPNSIEISILALGVTTSTLLFSILENQERDEDRNLLIFHDHTPELVIDRHNHGGFSGNSFFNEYCGTCKKTALFYVVNTSKVTAYDVHIAISPTENFIDKNTRFDYADSVLPTPYLSNYIQVNTEDFIDPTDLRPLQNIDLSTIFGQDSKDKSLGVMYVNLKYRMQPTGKSKIIEKIFRIFFSKNHEGKSNGIVSINEVKKY